jgi:hypothetical protein
LSKKINIVICSSGPITGCDEREASSKRKKRKRAIDELLVNLTSRYLER